MPALSVFALQFSAASLMAVIYLISRIIERDRDLFNLLGFAALVLLLINPAQLWDIGFQLSFVAVASIVYLAPKWEHFIARIIRLNRVDPMADPDSRMAPRSVWGRAAWWVVMAFGVTLSAQVGTTLIIAWHFHRIYPIGLVAGLFTVGLAAFLVNITLVSVLLGLIWLPLAIPFVLCEPLRPLDFSGACRIFRSIMDSAENTISKFRFYRYLHRRLFRGCALGVGVDASKAGYDDWVDGSVHLDLGRRLA